MSVFLLYLFCQIMHVHSTLNGWDTQVVYSETWQLNRALGM